MAERVKLERDTQTPNNGLKSGSVRSRKKHKRPRVKTGTAARALFTENGGDNPPPARGRPPGAQNKTTRILKEALLLAAEQTGENLRGRHGLVGYLRRQARREPRAFMGMLARVLPMQVNVDSTALVEVRNYHSVADIKSALRERGITVDEIYEKPMKVIEHRKDELNVKAKPKSAVERALVNV